MVKPSSPADTKRKKDLAKTREQLRETAKNLKRKTAERKAAKKRKLVKVA